MSYLRAKVSIDGLDSPAPAPLARMTKNMLLGRCDRTLWGTSVKLTINLSI